MKIKELVNIDTLQLDEWMQQIKNKKYAQVKENIANIIDYSNGQQHN